ncbi:MULTISPECIES: hydroxymethylbilane synthase [Aestuariimicrobium]|uniref:hydroxymethylbilane synthase n=1 Tax=Aestuariimicrobium TaxID=396388 RepID=UPI0003B54B4C|nr:MULTISPECIES: hydroxymethylbilane synthase [Aestuariimicrobium]CAI9405263.1 Porphobilinogen deaminase [Aestuariimicrobium sp. T2.26MG-19.2B]
MIHLGARRSPLAVVQAEYIAGLLRGRGHEVTLVGITSEGDTDRRALTEIGGTGVFAAAVRARLLDGSIDLAVHSLKDLPVAPHPGLVVAATPTRERVNDVLVGRPIDEWDDATVVGTGSPRRQAQLAALAADRGIAPTFVSVRGNVDTRLNLVTVDDDHAPATGQPAVHATVLARAGLARLGKVPAEGPLPADLGTTSGATVRLTELGLDQVLPAPGQGALGVECRESDERIRRLLADLDDPATRAAVTAEREFLATLEAGCLAPVGAWAHVDGEELELQVCVADNGGLVRLQGRAPWRDSTRHRHLGQDLAETVLSRLDGSRPGVLEGPSQDSRR